MNIAVELLLSKIQIFRNTDAYVLAFEVYY